MICNERSQGHNLLIGSEERSNIQSAGPCGYGELSWGFWLQYDQTPKFQAVQVFQTLLRIK